VSAKFRLRRARLLEAKCSLDGSGRLPLRSEGPALTTETTEAPQTLTLADLQAKGNSCASCRYWAIVAERRAPLRSRYATHPDDAISSKCAKTSPAEVGVDDPFHVDVGFGR